MKKEMESLKQPRVLTGVAMFIALNVILNYFNIMIGTTLRIGISFLPIAVCGMMYGPMIGGMAGMVGDILGYITKPGSGDFYFMGFTISAFCVGFLFGMFLYRKQITLIRVAAAVLMYTILISLILSPIWLYMMYGSALFALPRVYKAALQYPINVVMVYTVTKYLSRCNIIQNRVY